jgi:hypothetical protein
MDCFYGNFEECGKDFYQPSMTANDGNHYKALWDFKSSIKRQRVIWSKQLNDFNP